MIFVKWKEELWCRASVVEILQNGCMEGVKACKVTQLASIRVFYLDYGLTKTITIQRYTHKWMHTNVSASHRLKIEQLRQAQRSFYSDIFHILPKQ